MGTFVRVKKKWLYYTAYIPQLEIFSLQSMTEALMNCLNNTLMLRREIFWGDRACTVENCRQH